MDSFEIPLQDQEIATPDQEQFIEERAGTRANALHNDAPEGELIRALVDKLELLLGIALPVASVVYDFCAFAYAALSHRRLFVGDPVSVEHLAVMGAAVLVPMLPAGGRALSTAVLGEEAAEIVRVAGSRSLTATVPPEALAVLGSLPTSTQEELATTLVSVLERKQRPREMALSLHRALK